MRRLLLCGVLVFAGAPLSAALAGDTDLDAIRQQIESLRKDYETRIQALEQRLEQAESQAREAETAAGEARRQVEAVAVAPAPPVTAQERINAFNPAISAVLQGSFNSYSQDPDDYAISGFGLGGEAELAAQGLTLDETEVTIAANVDPLFYGQTTVSLSDTTDGTDVSVEEAFADALTLPGGVGLRFGKFFSDIGYLNHFHTHAWDFHDAPLVYNAMLGKQYGDTGVQVSWLAPTDTYLRVGGEALRGSEFPGGDADKTIGNSQSLFVKLGGDVGSSNSWLVGLSQLWVDAVDRNSNAPGVGDSAQDSFTGDSNLTIADLVWKWAPNGNPRNRNFKFQTELFYRDEDGRDRFSQNGSTAVLDYDGTQKGLYAQAIYQFMQQWRIGTRYDWLSADNNLNVRNPGGLNPKTVLNTTALNDHNHDPKRWSLMADWSPSEFSRLRLQYNRDRSRDVTDHQWSLQYIMSLGAHGAHEF